MNRCNLNLRSVVICVVVVAAQLMAGQSLRNSFTLQLDGIHDSAMVSIGSKPALAIKRYATIKLFGDTLPSSPSPSHSPDVFFEGHDTATFWYVDKDNKRIMRQRSIIQPSGTPVTLAPDREIDLKNVVAYSYLHVDKGSGGYLSSIVQNAENGFPYLSLHDGTGARNIDTTKKYGWLYASQAVLQGDTFLVVTSSDVETVKLKKVYARGNNVSVIEDATIFTGKKTADSSLLNCAVAADPDGDIIALSTRGGPGSVKYLEYKLLDRSLNTIFAGKLANPVGDDNFYYYDDAGIVSYADNKFAVATWDQAGVYLNLFKKNGNSINVTTSKVIDKPGMKFVTIAASGRYLVIACVGDRDGNSMNTIEGIHYKIVNGEPDSARTITLSDAAVPIIVNDNFSTAINSAVNDSGLFAVTWRNQLRVAGCIWTYRGIRHSSGFYQSPVEVIPAEIDSLLFKPVNTSLSSSTSWNTTGKIRSGTTPEACSTGTWISFNDQAVLQSAKNNANYFQYRIYLSRKTSGVIDSFNTPRISSVNITWNAQPRISAIDSVVSGSALTPGVVFGDTVNIISRSDTARFHLDCIDPDSGDQGTISVSLPAVETSQSFPGGDVENVNFSILPLPASDTVYSCTLKVKDQEQWNGVSKLLNFRTRNLLPQLQMSIGHTRTLNGVKDSVLLTNDTVLVLQEEDTFYVYYSVQDSNDPLTVQGSVVLHNDTGIISIDSTGPGNIKVFRLIADTVVPRDTVFFGVRSIDKDTSVGFTIKSIVNHKPVISHIVIGNETLTNGDTANVVIDDSALFEVVVHDTDLAFGDTATYSYRTESGTGTLTTVNSRGTLLLLPDENDTLVVFRVNDRFGRTDSFTIHCAFPWFETDSATYPEFDSALEHLMNKFSLIDGSEIVDTIMLPVFNNGRNDLVITEIRIGESHNNWLKVIAECDDDSIILTRSKLVFTGACAVEQHSVWNMLVVASAEKLTGDSIVTDTLTITTNDPRHRIMKIPVQIECNDLPRVVAISPFFEPNVPYRTLSKKTAYRFPPHASIEVSFSEPMDTASARSAISIHSVNDRRFTGIEEPIPLTFTWMQNATKLSILPDYQKTSPSFRVKPPSGLFIPTDSIMLVISSSLHDQANTPSGPNPLDLNIDLQRDNNSDTAIGLRIDSIAFTIAQIDPQPGRSDIRRDESVTLTFSAPAYIGTIDTSCVNNRSFTVTSRYNEGKPLRFSKVTKSSSSVVFSFEQELFYRDSLECSYASRWIRDSLGYATDNNEDGIDATIFDSSARQDDLSWGYRVKALSVVSVDPESASVRKEVSPLITLRFDGKIPGGVFDMDTSLQNRSISIGSGRTGFTSLADIRFTDDSTSVIVRPRLTFFSNDSVYCQFKGFTDDFRYAQQVNLPSDSLVFGTYSWHFHSGEIGFYTYPNPYTPNSNSRHCKDNGPCGIWFKNLHTLSEDIYEVRIRIYSMNAHPVFDTHRTGVSIRFNANGTEELPQWKWDTRNNRGDLTASGIYLYTISDVKGTLLKKGKLVIAR